MICLLRGYHFSEDSQIQDKVPSGFPGKNLLLVEEPPDENGIRQFNLPDGYRVGGTPAEMETLKYFFGRMVAACNPTQNKFREKKCIHTISNIFPSSDEAFALLVLYNESHRWKVDAKKKIQNKRVFGEIENTTATQQVDETQQNKKGNESPKKRKRFTDAQSGSREGWSIEGRKLYQDLCIKIDDLRKSQCTGERVEEKLRKKFGKENGIDTDEWTERNTGGFDAFRPAIEIDEYFPESLNSLWNSKIKTVQHEI